MIKNKIYHKYLYTVHMYIICRLFFNIIIYQENRSKNEYFFVLYINIVIALYLINYDL